MGRKNAKGRGRVGQSHAAEQCTQAAAEGAKTIGERVESMPMLYMDGKTIIREVFDLSSMRRGDHCLIALNLFQSMSKHLDALVSLLGSWELISLYHHFIVMDDVCSVDLNGVPLRADGRPVTIGEFSNTVPAGIKGAVNLGSAPSMISHVHWLYDAVRLVTGLPKFIFQKADFRSRQLGVRVIALRV
jgi:hypothetical protein